MEHLEVFIVVLFVSVAGLNVLARRLAAPYPIVLVIGGLALGLLPGMPEIELDPDFLAAGPRDVMVAESGAAAAREILREAELAGTEAEEQPFGTRAVRLFAGVLVVGFVGLLLAWVLFQTAT